MSKELIRAYFKAYRARITDLEEKISVLQHDLDNAYGIARASFARASAQASRMEEGLRQKQYSQWRLEDENRQLKRKQRRVIAGGDK